MIEGEIYRYVSRQIKRLNTMPIHPQKAMLANLRRGIGRVPGDMPELWGIFLQDLPQEMQSKDGNPTREEWAIYLSLTLYALHQQSQDKDVNKPGASFGNAVRKLAEPGQEPEESSSFRRFQALLTASSIEESAHYLRAMIQLLRQAGIGLDYPQLAEDLYLLQIPALASKVRLKWGQEYYFDNNIEND